LKAQSPDCQGAASFVVKPTWAYAVGEYRHGEESVCKAVEWQITNLTTNVAMSDSLNNRFSMAKALLEIAKTIDAAAEIAQ
jgi:hypothetical protein